MQYDTIRSYMVYVNSPMSILLSLAPFLGQLGAWFKFGRLGRVQDHQIQILSDFRFSDFWSVIANYYEAK